MSNVYITVNGSGVRSGISWADSLKLSEIDINSFDDGDNLFIESTTWDLENNIFNKNVNIYGGYTANGNFSENKLILNCSAINIEDIYTVLNNCEICNISFNYYPGIEAGAIFIRHSLNNCDIYNVDNNIYLVEPVIDCAFYITKLISATQPIINTKVVISDTGGVNMPNISIDYQCQIIWSKTNSNKKTVNIINANITPSELLIEQTINAPITCESINNSNCELIEVDKLLSFENIHTSKNYFDIYIELLTKIVDIDVINDVIFITTENYIVFDKIIYNDGEILKTPYNVNYIKRNLNTKYKPSNYFYIESINRVVYVQIEQVDTNIYTLVTNLINLDNLSIQNVRVVNTGFVYEQFDWHKMPISVSRISTPLLVYNSLNNLYDLCITCYDHNDLPYIYNISFVNHNDYILVYSNVFYNTRNERYDLPIKSSEPMLLAKVKNNSNSYSKIDDVNGGYIQL